MKTVVFGNFIAFNLKKPVMKKIIPLIALLFCISCSKKINTFSNPDPKIFVEQIKSGTYNTKSPEGFVEIPDFNKADIGELIKYVKDLRAIKSYPINPLSSITFPERYLGESLMWTIEGIRSGTKYPSLGGRLGKKGSAELLTKEEILQVADIYISWWRSVKGMSDLTSVNYYAINPLENTNYFWR